MSYYYCLLISSLVQFGFSVFVFSVVAGVVIVLAIVHSAIVIV